jgi:hypothetical protein
MTQDEIKKVNSLAVRGDLESAALEFLGYESIAGHEATVGGVVFEVEQWNKADNETRAGIESYKAAKSPANDVKKAAARSPKSRTAKKKK